MLRKNLIKKSLAVLTLFSLINVLPIIGLAAADDATASISVTGSVTVNGQPTISNSTIVSGSLIETVENSSATISLGKPGRIELLANTSLTLKFSQSSIIGILNAGKVRVSNAAGVATTFTTKDATIIADAGQANTFALETECSHTHLDSIAGLVTMRSGTNDRQVAAGTDAVAGNMQQTGCQPCKRPGTVIPIPVAGIGAGALAAILLAIGGAVATGIIIGTQGSDTTTGGGGTVVVSPTR